MPSEHDKKGENLDKSESSGVYPYQKDSDASFGHLNPEAIMQENTFTEIMQKMSSKHYSICEDQELLIYEKCKLLFEKDYICKVVNNCNYTMNYPVRIIVPFGGKKMDIEDSFMDFDDALYSKLVEGAHNLRRRKRFVTPAILFDNKFICRSSTLAVELSTLSKIAAEMVPPRIVVHDEDALDILGNYNIASTLLKADVELLEYLKIERIVDLLTHFSKMCPKTVSFVTTEKEHENLYNKIKIEEMPYIGSNYFPIYHKANRNVEDLLFDWKAMDEKRQLNLTEDPKVFFSEINADSNHKSWDLSKLTQNYLKIMLSQLVTGNGGMVIHCASGWDRTPLFISLLRLSLWADGVVHESLEFEDITYLTVAYDWFLFGHKFPLRFNANEEIMHFTFNFLKCITSDEFSITRLFHKLPPEKKRNRLFPEFVPGRRISLNKVRSLFLEIYDKEIIKKKE